MRRFFARPRLWGLGLGLLVLALFVIASVQQAQPVTAALVLGDAGGNSLPPTSGGRVVAYPGPSETPGAYPAPATATLPPPGNIVKTATPTATPTSAAYPGPAETLTPTTTPTSAAYPAPVETPTATATLPAYPGPVETPTATATLPAYPGPVETPTATTMLPAYPGPGATATATSPAYPSPRTTPTATLLPPYPGPVGSPTATLPPPAYPGPTRTATLVPPATRTPGPYPGATLPPYPASTETATPQAQVLVCDGADSTHICHGVVKATVYIDYRCNRVFDPTVDTALAGVEVQVRLDDGRTLTGHTDTYGETLIEGVQVTRGHPAQVHVGKPTPPQWVVESGLMLAPCGNSSPAATLTDGSFSTEQRTNVAFRFAVQ